MADVLLTHSYHLPYDAKQSRKMQPYLPLGTLYAATTLQQRSLSVVVFDPMLTAPEPGFGEILQNSRAKIVVVYEDDFNFLTKMCLTRMREVAWEMARVAKQAGAMAIVHGSDSTDHPDLFLGHGFDYVLCGESEDLLADVCERILAGERPDAQDGLIQSGPEAGSPQAVHRLARNGNWSDLPAPPRDLVDLEPYRSAWKDAHGYFSTNMVASRGCPFRCNWCAKPISGDRFQLRAAAEVAEEMLALKRSGVEHIWFSDDIFALNHRWMDEFAVEVGSREAALPYKIQSRADLMREDTVRSLKLSGCAEVWMGVESGSQKILDAMDKGITLDEVKNARHRLRQAGIKACFFLQFGYPGETWTELQQTIELVRALRPDDIGISFSYPLPGTIFYERVRSQLGVKRNWADSSDLCVLFKAAYTTDFYRAVREALHAEVDEWSGQSNSSRNKTKRLWQKVEEMEPLHRVADAFQFSEEGTMPQPPLVVIEGMPLDERRA